MNHYAWTYVGDNGFSIPVGLYHSPTSGNLMVYVGQKVTIVDFEILDSKQYSFFINDEMVIIELERRRDKMYYKFKIDKEVDTPRNKARKKIERKHLLWTAGFALSIFAFFMIVIALSPDHPATVSQNDAFGIATIEINENNPSQISYFYSFGLDNYEGEVIFEKGQMLVSPKGMPLRSGDEFVIRFKKKNPQNADLKLAVPTSSQLEKYKQRAIERHRELNPDLDDTRVRCMVKIAYELKGIAGLADFIFQNTPPDKNQRNNKNTFLRLIRDLPFQNKLKILC